MPRKKPARKKEDAATRAVQKVGRIVRKTEAQPALPANRDVRQKDRTVAEAQPRFKPAALRQAHVPEPQRLEVVIVGNGDDWEALYVNGAKVYENHSIPAHEILRHIPGVVMEHKGVSAEWSEGNAFPPRLSLFPDEAWDSGLDCEVDDGSVDADGGGYCPDCSPADDDGCMQEPPPACMADPEEEEGFMVGGEEIEPGCSCHDCSPEDDEK
jgi:hypothetical protein